MSSIAKAFPFLEHLNNNTLIMSPTYKKRLNKSFRERPDPGSWYTGYLVGIGSNDEVDPGSFFVFLDLDRRWPRLVTRFRSQVALVSEAFGAAIAESFTAFEKDSDSTNAFLAGKTFSGTLLMTGTKSTFSYALTYDGKGDITDYSVLWLDCSGSIMAYVVPGMEFISRSILKYVSVFLSAIAVSQMHFYSSNVRKCSSEPGICGRLTRCYIFSWPWARDRKHE